MLVKVFSPSFFMFNFNYYENLKSLSFGANEVLQKNQMKSVLGGRMDEKKCPDTAPIECQCEGSSVVNCK